MREFPMPNPLHQSPTRPMAATYIPLQGTVTPIDPSRCVSLRAGATSDPAVLHVKDEAAVKHNTFSGRNGYAGGGAHWQTHLHVEVWVQNTTYVKSLWADVHVFGHDGALVARETSAFVYERPAGDGGDIFRLDRAVYEGATATPGSATPRPDVRLVQYRIYGELDGRVLTDGLLHECLLKADVVSR